MILKQENNLIIRTIEHYDKDEILEMFKKDDFGFFGILADQRPSLYDEMVIIDKVLAKEVLNEEYILLEIEGIIVTYACIFQDGANRIHIGSIITKQEYRNNGYGSYLLEFIKEYANQNNFTIITESITCGNLLRKLGFKEGRRNSDYTYIPKDKCYFKEKYPIFLDYEGNKKIELDRENEELESFSKTLDFLKQFGWF